MSDKPYNKIGKTYYPKPRSVQITDSEVRGSMWRVWREKGKAYFEYDAGHFGTNLKTVEITIADFELVKARKISDKELALKYGEYE